MRNRRIPPAVIPVTAFLTAAIIYAAARHALTLKGFLVGIAASAIVVLATTRMHRGPYI